MKLSRASMKRIKVDNDRETGQRIKERRQSLGVTQIQLAKALRVSQAEISNIERGTKKPISVQQFAQALNVPVTYIIQGK